MHARTVSKAASERHATDSGTASADTKTAKLAEDQEASVTNTAYEQDWADSAPCSDGGGWGDDGVDWWWDSVVMDTAGEEQSEQQGVQEEYFEAQEGEWCGMHALNNYKGGPYVDRDACRDAARGLCRDLSQRGAGDTEDLDHHLDPVTGFLSIDVINCLGAAQLGIHVEGSDTPWDAMLTGAFDAALVNWSNRH